MMGMGMMGTPMGYGMGMGMMPGMMPNMGMQGMGMMPGMMPGMGMQGMGMHGMVPGMMPGARMGAMGVPNQQQQLHHPQQGSPMTTQHNSQQQFVPGMQPLTPANVQPQSVSFYNL
jgi:morphogenetic protein associated with SpoVID